MDNEKEEGEKIGNFDTKNPGKIEGAKKAFEKYFESVIIEGVAVESEVPPQPVNEETFFGAKNRIKN